MEPIRGFVSAMALKMPIAKGRMDFVAVNRVLNVTTECPAHVNESINLLSENVDAERCVLAATRALGQGKKLLTLHKNTWRSVGTR